MDMQDHMAPNKMIARENRRDSLKSAYTTRIKMVPEKTPLMSLFKRMG